MEDGGRPLRGFGELVEVVDGSFASAAGELDPRGSLGNQKKNRAGVQVFDFEISNTNTNQILIAGIIRIPRK